MEVITRAQAKASGSTTYFTGKPCARGHVSIRYTSIGKCRECSFEDTANARAEAASAPEKVARRTAIEERKKADPDRKEYFASYRRKNAKECQARSSLSKAKKLDLYRAKRRERRKANADEENRKRRDDYKRNAEKQRILDKRRRESNQSHYRLKVASRRAMRLKATPAWADLLAMQEIYQKASDLGWHVDHIVPLQSKLVCGLHCEANLQVLSPEENRAKSNRWWPDMP